MENYRECNTAHQPWMRNDDEHGRRALHARLGYRAVEGASLLTWLLGAPDTPWSAPTLAAPTTPLAPALGAFLCSLAPVLAQISPPSLGVRHGPLECAAQCAALNRSVENSLALLDAISPAELVASRPPVTPERFGRALTCAWGRLNQRPLAAISRSEPLPGLAALRSELLALRTPAARIDSLLHQARSRARLVSAPLAPWDHVRAERAGVRPLLDDWALPAAVGATRTHFMHVPPVSDATVGAAAVHDLRALLRLAARSGTRHLPPGELEVALPHSEDPELIDEDSCDWIRVREPHTPEHDVLAAQLRALPRQFLSRARTPHSTLPATAVVTIPRADTYGHLDARNELLQERWGVLKRPDPAHTRVLVLPGELAALTVRLGGPLHRVEFIGTGSIGPQAATLLTEMLEGYSPYDLGFAHRAALLETARAAVVERAPAAEHLTGDYWSPK